MMQKTFAETRYSSRLVFTFDKQTSEWGYLHPRSRVGVPM